MNWYELVRVQDFETALKHTDISFRVLNLNKKQTYFFEKAWPAGDATPAQL